MGAPDTKGARLWATYEGIVTQRVDPEGLGRVKVKVPGVLEPESEWLRPMSTFGGSKDRGVFAVPKVGANVEVVFLHGDPRYARYTAGPWGRPGGVSEVPAEAPTGNPDIVVIRFGNFAIVIDETVGAEKATILDVTNGSKFEFDLVTGNVKVIATGDLNIEATTGKCVVDVKGGNAEVNVTAGDAKVTASGKVELEAPEIKLGSAASLGVVLASIRTWLDGHVHSGGTLAGGLTGAPTIPTIPTDFSTTVKAKV